MLFRSWGRVVEQRALAAFIQEGHYTRHLQRMRRLYVERLGALRTALMSQWPWPLALEGETCGMHVVLRLPEGVDDQAVARALTERGLGARALSSYHVCDDQPHVDLGGLVLGYAHVPAQDMSSCVKALTEAVRACEVTNA